MVLKHLFSPFKLGDLDLGNRVVMAPMTRCFSPGGVPGENVADYYRRRAEGGVGLIITEGTAINHPAAITNPAIPRFYGTDALDGWRKLVDQVHQAGGAIFPQLWHTGSARQSELSANPDIPAISPSGLFAPGKPVGRAAEQHDIEMLVTAFGDAAANAMDIGCDGIELHFAHGYLVDQFFWDGTNCRDDIYGEDRTRFAAEIVAECRKRTRPDFPIALRFSQWKQQEYEARLFETPDDLERFLAPLTDAGVDIFHCSSRRFWLPEFADSAMNLAGWTKRLSGKPVITVGSVGLDQEFLATRTGLGSTYDGRHLDALDGMLARGEVDLVAVGRALLVDHEWPRKVAMGRFSEIIPYSKSAELTLA